VAVGPAPGVGCNSWFYSNQHINALRYLGVMAIKNVGCVC
jgi:hypothetical protein